MITITRFNLHAVVTGSTAYYRKLVVSYANKALTQFDFINRTRSGQPIKKAIFYIYKNDEVYIPINMVEPLLLFLKNRHRITSVEIDIINTVPDTPVVNLPLLSVNKKFEAYDYQETAYKHINKDRGYNCSLTALGTGLGKLESLENIVPTPTGPQRWGDLHIGDDLIGSDGYITKITAEYPQPLQMTYKVFFIDGTSTVVGGPHLWKVRDRSDDNEKVIETQKMAKSWMWSGGSRYAIPISPGFISNVSSATSCPHTLGQAIYHGHITDIPSRFMYSSTSDRSLLWKGIFPKGLKKPPCITSKSLLTKILYLGRSLGFQLRYTVTPIRSLLFWKPTRHSYKVEKVLNTKLSQWKDITRIMPYGRRPSKCVTVAATDSLYCTTDFNLTHNTISAVYAADKTTNPIVVIVRPSLLPNWKKEINFIYPELDDSDIKMVKGSAIINKLTQMDAEDVPRWILISLASYRSYVNKWIRESYDNPFEFEVPPIEFFSSLNVRRLIIDEAHRELHAFTMIILTARVNRLIALSATMLSQDRFIEGIQKTIYPMDIRYDLLLKQSHINYVLSEYRFTDIDRVSLSPRGRTTYSHNHYEKSILRNRTWTAHYFEYILTDATNSYINRARPGDKLLILFGMHATMEAFKEYLDKHISDSRFVVHIHGAGMEDSLLDAVDIILATNGKLGLGTDIPGLISVQNTVSTLSIDTNIQTIGRLRPPTLKIRKGYRDDTYMDDRDRIFVQSHCVSIPKHCQYEENRRYILDKYLKSRRRYLYQYDI